MIHNKHTHKFIIQALYVSLFMLASVQTVTAMADEDGSLGTIKEVVSPIGKPTQNGPPYH